MFRNFYILFFFFSPNLWSRQIYSWQNCIDTVTRKNSQLEASRSTLESNENLIGKSKYNFFPQLSADLLNDRGENIGMLRVVDAPSTNYRNYTNNYVALLTGRLNLFNGLKDLGGVRQANANTDASEQNLLATKSKLSYELKTAFEGLKIAKEYQKLTQIFIKRRLENLNIVELRYTGGMENKGSVLLSKSTLEDAKYDDLVAKNNERVSRAQLARALGLDEFSEIDIRGEIPISDPTPNPDFRELALSSPYYKEAVFKEQSSEAGITVARAEFFPNLNIVGTAGKQGTSFWPDDIDRWTLAVTITFPFFNGGRDYYGTKSAVNTWAAATSSRLDTSRDVLQNLQKTYTTFVEAVVKNNVDKSFMEAGKLRAEIARKKYNNGLLIFDDWIIIENAYIEYSKAYLLSKRERVIAEANWEYA
ncbi:MAG: TolC family protein, partial [Bacteriovoracales bacterium]